MGLKSLQRAGMLFLLSAVCCISVLAHPGNTDGNGGHWDRSMGEYHYHHGYPAHQHTNGVCPYDFDDKTSETSGTLSPNPVIRALQGNTPQKKKDIVDSRNAAASSTGQDADEDRGNREVWIFLIFLGLPALSVGSAAIASVHDERLANARRAAEAERLQAEQQANEERLQAEREQFLLAYDGKSLNEVIPPPQAGDAIGEDGLPFGAGDGRWGRYTVYITQKGEVYHSRSVCGTACGRAVNLALVRNRRPCSRCCKQIPDLWWYDQQTKLLAESDRLFGRSVFKS